MEKNSDKEFLDRIEDFFSDLTSGNYSLPMTYWVYGVLGGFVWAVAISSIVGALSSQVGAESLRSILQVLYLMMLGYFAAVYIGIWKSADKYEGNKIWSVLAKFIVIVTSIPMIAGTLKIITQSLHKFAP